MHYKFNGHWFKKHLLFAALVVKTDFETVTIRKKIFYINVHIPILRFKSAGICKK